MQTNTGIIQVIHAGSLPRTDQLVAANAVREFSDDGFTLLRTPGCGDLLSDAVGDLVRRQLVGHSRWLDRALKNVRDE